MRRLIIYGSVAVMILAAIVGFTAFQVLRTPLQVTNRDLKPENCSPGPCTDVQGFTIWISEVTIEGDLVSMKVRFRNSSAATHVSPGDLQLIDTTRHVSGLETGVADCTDLKRHDFNNGATWGPMKICFRVLNTTRPLVLHWTPDLGNFCCETDIKIT